jgi:hypothetical protein
MRGLNWGFGGKIVPVCAKMPILEYRILEYRLELERMSPVEKGST